jgi:hypothetical protein
VGDVGETGQEEGANERTSGRRERRLGSVSKEVSFVQREKEDGVDAPT